MTEELWKPPGPSIKEEVKCQMLLMNPGKGDLTIGDLDRSSFSDVVWTKT